MLNLQVRCVKEFFFGELVELGQDHFHRRREVVAHSAHRPSRRAIRPVIRADRTGGGRECLMETLSA
jgi:hypothetical protein